MVASRGTLNQVLSIIAVAFNDFSIGFAIAWLAPTLTILQDPKGEFKATLDDSSWLACIQFAGVIPGALVAAFAIDIVGRKILLTSASFIFFSMWIVNAMTNSMLVLCLVRFVFGFFVGINDCTNSTYVGENCSPKVRGAYGGVCVTFYYTGLLLEYAIASYFSYRVTSIINAVIIFLAFISALWMKEPVQFLLMKGKVKQAEKNFAWLRGGNPDDVEINQEFERIKKNAQSENLKKSSLKEMLTSPANYKSLSIVITLYTLSGCTGYSAVLSFASVAFSASDILTANDFTILFAVVQFLAVIPTTFFIDRFHRRPVVLFSFSLIALCHAATAILYYTESHIFKIPYFPWLVFSSITLYATTYFVIIYPIIFIIRGELFPLSVKATGGCLAVVSCSLTAFVTSIFFLHVIEIFGIEMNFIIYCVFSIILVVFSYFFLPETKNKTLIEIQEALEKKK